MVIGQAYYYLIHNVSKGVTRTYSGSAIGQRHHTNLQV